MNKFSIFVIEICYLVNVHFYQFEIILYSDAKCSLHLGDKNETRVSVNDEKIVFVILRRTLPRQVSEITRPPCQSCRICHTRGQFPHQPTLADALLSNTR